MSALLQLRGVEAGYGDFQALFGIDLEVRTGALYALVGANGAGKSTLLNAIMGSRRLTAGSIVFDGRDVTHLQDYERARIGIGLVPEGRRLFPSMSVEENLVVGRATRRSGPWDLAAVYEALPLLHERRQRPTATLSGGEQQLVAIGRALMGNPRLLLMDEVSLGLAPVAVERVYASLPAIRETGSTVVLVEQDLSRTLRIADTVSCVLEGRIALSGAAGDLGREAVTAAYFGTERTEEIG